VSVKDKGELKGLGGWLFLVAISVTLSPFVAVVTDYAQFFQVITIEEWGALRDINSPTYIPYYGLVVTLEAIFSFIIDAYLFYLMYLFWSEKSGFPSLYIKVIFASLIYTIVNIIAISLVLPDLTTEDLFDEPTIRVIVHLIFTILVWVPYMIKSVRVKNTFIN
jgi:hypothetical protein